MGDKLRAGILGFGGMGHFHAALYAGQPDAELVAVCDVDPAKLELEVAEINLGASGKTDLARLRQYTAYEDMVKAERLDLVDICLPTDLHAPYALRALRDGHHVLSEKPMARTVAECDELIRCAGETGKRLMIAQCLRFAAGYRYILEAYRSGRLGRLLRLALRRHGGPPGNWFRDGARSGGALLDLHLHDVDFVNAMLGVPVAVSARGIPFVTDEPDDCAAVYEYADPVLVTADSSWSRAGFVSEAAAVFERGTLELKDDRLTLMRVDQPVETIALPAGSPYFDEIAYFAACVKAGRAPELALPASTRDSVRIVFAERASIAAAGARIAL